MISGSQTWPTTLASAGKSICLRRMLLYGIDGSRLPRQSPDLGQLDRRHVFGCGITCCGGSAVGIAVGLKGRLHVAQHFGEERIAIA
jgi:hypothetical protein